MTLLEQRERDRAGERLRLYDATRRRLREALQATAPGHEFWLFGSLRYAGRFNAASDVDLAFTTLPEGMTEYVLAAELEERLGRPVDLVDLQRTRLRAKIEREGERWII
jgi:predicted nucleotidyltransferase